MTTTTNVILIRRSRTWKGQTVHYWALRWQDSDGRYRSESLGRADVMSALEARKLWRARIGDLGAGKAIRDKPAKLTVAAFLEQDREAISSASKPSTLITHRQASDHLAAAIGGATALAKIDWQKVGKLKKWMTSEHVINGKTRKPCSKATVRKTLVTLKAAWNRGIERKQIVTNPFVERMGKIQARQKRIYSTAEFGAMLEACSDPWWDAFLSLAFATGLRVGELLNLTWDDIDNGHVVVSAKRCGKFVVGGVTYPMLPWSCKSHSERRVPLAPDMVTMLGRRRMKADGSPYVFLSLSRLLGLRAKRDVTQEIPANALVNNMRRQFIQVQQAAAKSLGAPWTTGTMHDLRKSFATRMARHVSMPDLQKLLGHESIMTTAKFYTEASDDVVDAVRLAFAG